jgi:uncharacterized membrane protein (UPF0127 family)
MKCIFLISLVMLAVTSSAQHVRTFPVVSLTAGMHLIKAEIVANDTDRQQGLMFRKKMGENEGMLFVLDAPADICMWMKNTLIPLSVAFIDQNKNIINIEDMKPNTLHSHCAKRKASYALEMNQGWFNKKNIKPGTKINGI